MTILYAKALASGPEGKTSWGDRIRKGLKGIKDEVDGAFDCLGEVIDSALGPRPQPIPIPVNDGRQRPRRGPGRF